MKVKAFFFKAFLALAGVAFFDGYAAAQQAVKKWNIVFLFADDLGAPDLGAYGNPAIKTPNLDKLAREGVQFNRAYVTSSQCSPSRASILTGRSPHAVGASRLHVDAQKEFPSVIQMLKDAGYFTGAYRKVHQKYIESQFDFKGDKNLSEFFEKRPGDKPFFLWFGAFDPHRPYPGTSEFKHDPEKVIVPDYLPDTKAVRGDLANYYDEIHRFDREAGEILALLARHGLSENTIVMMSSDNGMPFPRAKATLYEAGIHVPLLIKWPGNQNTGSKSNELVSLVDLTPTWLEAAGVAIPANFEGVSLKPLLKGDTSNSRRYIFSERNWHDNWDPMRAIVSKRYKLIQNYRPEAPVLHILDHLKSPTWKDFGRLNQEKKLNTKLQWYFVKSKPEIEFYDLEKDPGEWNNLAGKPGYQALITQYQKELGQWMNNTYDFLPAPADSFPRGSKFNEDIDPLNAKEIKK